MTRDTAALNQGFHPRHHFRFFAEILAHEIPFQAPKQVAEVAHKASAYVKRTQTIRKPSEHHIFIGHGRSSVWKDLRDFLERRLNLQVEEFNSEPVAGSTVTDRIDEMLDRCTFAFLIMTGEDEHADATLHARENVIHETGRAQQKLGSKRAVVLLEEGCKTFSNLQGIVYIEFPKGKIRAAFEDIREVLEREKIIKASHHHKTRTPASDRLSTVFEEGKASLRPRARSATPQSVRSDLSPCQLGSLRDQARNRCPHRPISSRKGHEARRSRAQSVLTPRIHSFFTQPDRFLEDHLHFVITGIPILRVLCKPLKRSHSSAIAEQGICTSIQQQRDHLRRTDPSC